MQYLHIKRPKGEWTKSIHSDLGVVIFKRNCQEKIYSVFSTYNWRLYIFCKYVVMRASPIIARTAVFWCSVAYITEEFVFFKVVVFGICYKFINCYVDHF